MLFRARLLLLAVVVAVGSVYLFLDGRVSEGWMIVVSFACGLLAFVATVIFVSLLFRIHKADGKFYYDARNPLWMAVKFLNKGDKEIRLCKTFWQISSVTLFISFVAMALYGLVLAITQSARTPRSVSSADVMTIGMMLVIAAIIFLVSFGGAALIVKYEIFQRILSAILPVFAAAGVIYLSVLFPIAVQLKAGITLPTAVQNDLFGLAALAFAVILAVLAYKLFGVLRHTAFGELLANELCPTLEELPGTQS